MYQAHERSWWSRNWMWFIPAGCLSALILVAVAIALFVFVILGAVFGHIKSSDVYQEAMAQARANPAVVSALGTPIKDGRFPSGSIQTSGSSGSADLSISISGPKGKGTVYAVATRSAGQWSFSQLVVTVQATGQRIDLLSGNGTSFTLPSGASPWMAGPVGLLVRERHGPPPPPSNAFLRSHLDKLLLLSGR